MTNQNILLDKRTLERNIRKGLISEKEVNTYLTTLADKEGESEKILLEGTRDAADDANG